MPITNSGNVGSLIHKAIEEAVEQALNEEIAGVKERVEKRVRGSVGHIAARVLERFSFEMMGANMLKIVVDFNPPK